jgi:hypothetical protein
MLLREEASAHDDLMKEPQEALRALGVMYRGISAEERLEVDQLLAEQLASLDSSERFDALAIIRRFNISSTLPALRRLADWLATETEPGAPYERIKVIGIIENMPD